MSNKKDIETTVEENSIYKGISLLIEARFPNHHQGIIIDGLNGFKIKFGKGEIRYEIRFKRVK